ncbi:MAG: M48 family metallopeptidase [Candidatus Spechtbacterales bacterium]
MPNLYTHKDSNVRKTWLIITVFLLLVIGIGWFFSYYFNAQIILIFAVFFSVIMSVSSYWWSDKIVLALTHAKPVQKNDNPELYRIVENLCITAGLPMPRIYVLEENALNAFATGRDPKHAVIAVTRGLLNRLDKAELEGVISHELSHIGNRDMLVNTVVVVLAGFIALATDMIFRSFLWGGLGGRRDSRGSNGVILVVGLVAMVVAYFAATLMRFAVSRKREFLADASGAFLTRYPEGLASALEKISQDNTKLRGASNATAHLFFENPFKADALRAKGEEPGKIAKLFMTHPPVKDRIRALREM